MIFSPDRYKKCKNHSKTKSGGKENGVLLTIFRARYIIMYEKSRGRATFAVLFKADKERERI
ncbi:MAG TPA: hypothetical protein DCE65_06920 [Clostridiales bacterium]|nr:hypothetical protein [Clostridiales bacterium]